MDYHYDLHIHSCLSPCGDTDMTVRNIAFMSKLKGLDVIALTDHNSCANCAAMQKAAEDANIAFIPGMELCTAEDIHVICLLPDLRSALSFDRYIDARLPEIRNKPAVFGEQLILDENDRITGSIDKLLICAASLSITDAAQAVSQFGGFAFPAHIESPSNGILPILGAVPEDCGFSAVEIVNMTVFNNHLNAESVQNKYNILRNSDAHYLWDISEAVNTLQEPRETSFRAVFEKALARLRP